MFIANRHPRLRLNRRALVAMIHALDQHRARIRIPHPVFLRRELSLVFLTDAALARIHADFLDDPSITDVITFEGDPAFGTAGEICISADAAARQSGDSGSSGKRNDFSAELILYVVHGWLHLAGYDDLTPADKRAMRRAETRALAVLREENCLPKSHFVRR